jgi:hypothetical protein
MMVYPYSILFFSGYQSIMRAFEPSPTNRTYLISLKAPQSVALPFIRIREELRWQGFPDNPFPPGIPLLELSLPPHPPVPGLLPACSEALILEKHLAEYNTEHGEPWIIWPLKTAEKSHWLNNMAEALRDFSNREEKSGIFPEQPGRKRLFPLRSGLPLAPSREHTSQDTAVEVNRIPENPPGWRALNLICHEIEYLNDRPWYKSVTWKPLWTRRLKRAPGVQAAPESGRE